MGNTLAAIAKAATGDKIMQIDKKKLINYMKKRRDITNTELADNFERGNESLFYRSLGADSELVDLYVKVLEGEFDICS